MSILTVHLGEKTLELHAPDGARLLDVLRSAGLSVTAPCGGNGTCGKCLVNLNVGGTIRQVLACQTAVSGDTELFLPDTGSTDGLPADFRPAGMPAEHTSLPAGSPCGTEPVFGVRASGASLPGAAVDLGTTTVAVRLLDRNTGNILGEKTEWNALAPYGADVITRIQYVTEHADGLSTLGKALRNQIREMIRACLPGGVFPDSGPVPVFTAGNTVMEHLLTGIDPTPIASAPFRAETLFTEDRTFLFPDTPELLFRAAPCIASYVGGDILAGIPAAGLPDTAENETVLFIDVGTNGEMVLKDRNGCLCCSTATGPAFEGAVIRCGMRGSAGAVRHVSLTHGKPAYDVIGGGSPRGICGTGLIDLLAVLLKLEAVDEGGRLLPPDEAPDDLEAFLEEDENENGIFHLTPGSGVYLTAKDVRNLQLAKAAVRAGIEILLLRSGHTAAEVDRLVIAGSFGENLNAASAAAIGMIPEELSDKVRCAGNTSLAGAAAWLLSPDVYFGKLKKIRERCRYIELSLDHQFQDIFIDQMMFDA